MSGRDQDVELAKAAPRPRSAEEIEDLRRTFESTWGSWFEIALVVADRNLDLAAAYGGTMTAEDVGHALALVERGSANGVTSFILGQHIAAQGATVATLMTWLADVTEVLCGERPTGAMPDTTLAAARTLRSTAATLRSDLEASGIFLRAQENRLALPENKALSWAERWERLRLALERPPRTDNKTVDRLLNDADERVQEEGIRALRYRFDSERKTDTIETLIVERDELRATVAALQAKVGELEIRLREYHGEADGDDISHDDKNDGVAGIVAWVKENKRRLSETREGIFDTGFRCVSEGGETFYLDPEELEALQDECDALKTTDRNAMEQLRTEVERLKARAGEWERIARVHGEQRTRAESRLAAIRERANDLSAVAARSDLEKFRRWALEGDAPNSPGIPDGSHNPSMPSNGSGDSQQKVKITAYDFAAMSDTPLYPCSPACTHDDAVNPGHPERVKGRSEVRAAMHPNGSCKCDGEGACDWCRRNTASPDPQQRWMREHPEEVAKHQGKHVAVHATRGIVASASTYSELTDALKAQQTPDDQVVIEFVRPKTTPSEPPSARTEKYRRLYKKWKRRAQESVLDFYEGFLIGHKIGETLKTTSLKTTSSKPATQNPEALNTIRSFLTGDTPCTCAGTVDGDSACPYCNLREEALKALDQLSEEEFSQGYTKGLKDSVAAITNLHACDTCQGVQPQDCPNFP